MDGNAGNKRSVAGALKKLESMVDPILSYVLSAAAVCYCLCVPPMCYYLCVPHACCAPQASNLKLSPVLEAKLSAGQKHSLHVNRALLYLLSGRTDSARDLLAALAKAGAGAGDLQLQLQLQLLQAAVAAKEGKVRGVHVCMFTAFIKPVGFQGRGTNCQLGPD